MNRVDALKAATKRLTTVVEITLDAVETKDTAAYDVALRDAVAWSQVVTALRMAERAILVEVAR